MGKLGERAVVFGAGMAGLLAARVLAEFYGTVTLVERDVLRDGPVQRRGVPQGRHLHLLLSRGSQVLEHLFPGLLEELRRAGTHILDDGDLSRTYTRLGRYGLSRSGKFTDPAAVIVYLASRPFLEFHVRRRVGALDNVRFLDNHDVVEPVAIQDRVSGARVVDRDTGDAAVLEADMVIDAMGRTARTPCFLESLGYGRPVQQRSAANAAYSSQLLRIPAGMIAEKLVIVLSAHGSPGGGLLPYEDGTWILTVARVASDWDPPTDLAGVMALAEDFVPTSILAALHAAEPVGDVSVFRYPGAVWRRYDRMRRFPAGLLVIGDAICSLPPTYGQGMTMAALEAVALRGCLREGDDEIARRFFRAAAKRIRPTWAMNQLNDRFLSPVLGRRSLSRWLTDCGMNQTLSATENDIALTERFFRVTNLVDPPIRLLDPSFMLRVGFGRFGWPSRGNQPSAPPPCVASHWP